MKTSNIQHSTLNIERRGGATWRSFTWLCLITINVYLITAPQAHAQGGNVRVINPTSAPVPVNLVSGGLSAAGAANIATSQVTTSTTAGTLIIARPTRISCLIRNLDTSISVYIGPATVTAGNGMLLKAGESVVVSAVTLWQVIAASGTPVVAVADEYN